MAVLKTKFRDPRPIVSDGNKSTQDFVCVFSENKVLRKDFISEHLGLRCPSGLSNFWSVSEEAWLFKDVTFGQWGLHLFSPVIASNVTSDFSSERASEYLYGDFIFGEFMGDSDLLLIRADDRVDDFGVIYVVDPIGRRAEWPLVGIDLADFFNSFCESSGDKFWEIA